VALRVVEGVNHGFDLFQGFCVDDNNPLNVFIIVDFEFHKKILSRGIDKGSTTREVVPARNDAGVYPP